MTLEVKKVEDFNVTPLTCDAIYQLHTVGS